MTTDNAEIVALEKRANEEDDAKAMYILAMKYFNGEGVLQNFAKAVNWLEFSSSKDYAKAYNALGVMYDKGVGLPENDYEAAKYYNFAARSGHAGAKFNLATMFDKGRSSPSNDDERTDNLYLDAANQGHAKAQFVLGMMYYKAGKSESKDSSKLEAYRKAYVWLSLAVANGCEDATKDRQAAREKLEEAGLLGEAQDKALELMKSIRKKQQGQEE